MTERPPRPRAFRLDDARIAVDDGPAPLAPAAIIQSQHDPIPPSTTAAAPIDEAEREVEAAQKSGLLSRWRFSLAGNPLDRPRRPRLARLRPVDDEPDRGPVRQGRIAWADRPRLRRPLRRRRDRPDRPRDAGGRPADEDRRIACRAGRGARRRRPRRGAAAGRQSSSPSTATGRRRRTPAPRFRRPPPRSSTGGISSTSPSGRS